VLKSKIFNKDVKFISNIDYEILKDYGTFHNINKNQIICYKGHYPYGIFIAISGEILLEINKRNKEVIKSPVIVGFNSFKKNYPYTFTSIAFTNVNMLYISKTKFEDVLVNDKNALEIFE